MKTCSPIGVFHHTGIAAADFAGAVEFLRSIGFEPEGAAFQDESQGVRGQFLVMGGHRVEVLSDLPGSSTIRPWLSTAQMTPYHFAYLVIDLDSAIDELIKSGLRTVRGPTPAVAFDGRRIAFLSSRSRFLIELVETRTKGLEEVGL